MTALYFLLAGTLCVAPVAQVESRVEPRAARSGRLSAGLEVDTSGVGSAGPIIQRRVHERGSVLFRGAGIARSESSADPTVTVVVRDRTGAEPGFAFEVRVEYAGKAADPQPWAVDCELCTETELVAKVEQELEKVVSLLVTFFEEERVEDEQVTPAPPPLVTSDQPVEVLPPQPKPTLRNVGIGTLAVGVVALGVGVALALIQPKPLSDDPTRERFTQPPGFALIGVGGAATIAGATMLGIGISRLRRASQARAALGPTSLVVRF